jgi:glycosyltransferase involved in cell wall biosynthesis
LIRIAYLTPLYFDERSYLGGGERYPLNLARGVAMDGRYEVELVSYSDDTSIRNSQLASGVSLSVLPAARRRWGAERLSWEVADVIRSADLVHIHQVFTRSGEVGMLAAKLLRKPVCVTDHGGGSSALGRSLGILDLADRIVCYSRFGESLIGRCDTSIALVPGGVDDVFFTPPPEPAKREGVLYVGRLLPHKGIDRLLAAMPTDISLTICGRAYDSTYYEHLRALAAGRQVDFLLEQTDYQLRDLYRRAIAVVLPSVYVDCFGRAHAWPELMGYSLLEGMACETPGICSRVGGMPEYVSHGETGFVFDELADLTRAIERLAEDSSLVAHLGKAGRLKVERDYGLAPAGRAMRLVYEDTLDRFGA